ncbi:MAG: ATP-binding protein [Acidobacteriota bacterium]|nr:ATP-binding protein [Acidobacteriota bacterium]
MIERYSLQPGNFGGDTPKEFVLLSIIAQSFFQPFSLEDNLLVILTALTAGSGIGFNRAMLFLRDGTKLKATTWLGPRSPEEAEAIWTMLSSPGIGYAEVVAYNRDLVTRMVKDIQPKLKLFIYDLESKSLSLPALAAFKKEIILVTEARSEPLVDPDFINFIQVDSFLCLPLIAQEEVLGEIVVDKGITHAPIEARDIELARLCALLAGNYIYTTNLYKKVVEMEKMAALGEMAAFVSHQLRNPIVAIGGFTQQMLSSPCQPERCHRNLNIILEQVKHLEDIIYKLSHFLKITIRELQPVDVQSILPNLVERPDIKIKAAKKTISLKMSENLPLILCDPVYFEEAVVNILDNALDVTPEGGKVYLRARPYNNKYVLIIIKDSGPGLDEKSHDKLFSPFYTTKENGTGLGLLFVKRIIDICDGKMEVQSKSGSGTMFKLYFKVQERRLS